MKNSITCKKLFIFVFALIFLGIALCLGFTKNTAYADYSSSITGLSNLNFTNCSYTTSGKPYSPSSWSLADNADSNANMGVLPLDNEKFIEYKTVPGVKDASSDSNILLIGSKEVATHSGYKNNGTATLPANSYTIISMLVFTDTENNGASIYVTGLDKDYGIENISTGKIWDTYYFFIKTPTYKSQSINLELWLGTRDNTLALGEVFFDNIKINSVASTTFASTMAKLNTNNYKLIDLSGVQAPTFTNGDFENGFEGWQVTTGGGNGDITSDTTYSDGDKIYGIADTSDKVILGVDSNDKIPGLIYGSNKALFFNNKVASYITVKSTSTITIEQYAFYRLSVFAKGFDISESGATIALTEVTDNDAPLESTKTITTSSSSMAQYNGYTEYVFYIQGSPYKDIELEISFSLGTQDNKASGIIAFDNISLEKISYATYNEYKSATNATEFVLNNQTDTSNITNGAFNLTASDIEVVSPALPRDWTIENTTNSGIINLNKTQFEQANYPFAHPGVTGYPNSTTDLNKTTNNVLVLSTQNGFNTLTSNSFTISSDSIASVSAYIKTQDLLDGERATLKLVETSGALLVSKDITLDSWKEYTLYIKNTYTSLNVRLVLELGSTKNKITNGQVFIDNVAVNTSVDNEIFISKQNTASDYYATTNLSTNSFNSFDGKQDGVYIPTTVIAGNESLGTIAGIVDVTELTTSNPGLRNGATDNYVLMINNTIDGNFYYKNRFEYSLEEGSYYKISVWIKVEDLTSSAPNDEENNAYMGANFAITNTDHTFKAISSTANTDNNGWQEYTYYVKATNAQSLYISLGLGNAVVTSGKAYFDDLSVEKIEESYYLAATESDNVIVGTVTEETEEEETETEPTTPTTPVNVWILVPSLLLAVTLIAAIISIAIQNINFKKRVKVKPQTYDRTKSLNNDIVRRELAKVREEKIAGINKEIEQIKATMEQNKIAYENTIKGQTNKNKLQAEFTKYAKTNNKLEMHIDKLKSAITYLQDESNIANEEYKEIRRREKILEAKNKKTIKQEKKQKKVEDKKNKQQ